VTNDKKKMSRMHLGWSLLIEMSSYILSSHAEHFKTGNSAFLSQHVHLSV